MALRKLSTYVGDEALDMFANLMEPFAKILLAEGFREALKEGNKLRAIKIAIKENKKEVTEVLAVLEGEDPETYKPTLARIPILLLELINDPALIDLFRSQDQILDEELSGPATETITAEEN